MAGVDVVEAPGVGVLVVALVWFAATVSLAVWVVDVIPGIVGSAFLGELAVSSAK